MATRKPAPKGIAQWRYEQIEEALDERLHAEGRGLILRRICRAPVRWPSGITKKISLATLYRWLRSYLRGGLAALQPKPRRDRGHVRRPLPDEVVQEAVRLLSEDPGMSLSFLSGVLEARFAGRKLRIVRSTLQRRVAAHPSYRQIQRARKRTRRRTRFVARAAHEIWQTDAKGPLTLRLVSGIGITFHVLSILDDATRAVLAAIVAPRPDLAAAVVAFRRAALRWGLPERLYADRASIFDSKAFRMGLAQMGAYRIPTRPRNAEAHGKIEAYHRTLGLWFTDRLAHQQVVDLAHLQLLLDSVIHTLYQPHRHRGLKIPPEQALAGRVSSRSIPPTRLFEAFQQEKRLKAHPKTGEVEIQGQLYLVPDELRGQTLTFLLDPAAEAPPQLVHPESDQSLRLRIAEVRPDDVRDLSPPAPWGEGPLQVLYDSWRGQRRPQAEPGFGLPEIYALLSRTCGRHVPKSDAEAALVQRIYREIGPLPRAATESAMRQLAAQLGPHRPIKTYLDALRRRVRSASQNHDLRRIP
jgi:transposase InsO family protein